MNNYTYLAKVFHRLILDSKTIQEMSFYLESFFDKNRSKDFSKKPVFVMGLARSGTTTLLRLLHKTNQFESVSYRDVPFVLMPTLWHRLSKIFHLEMDAIERSHGDSILVNFDSPESFEAVFWRSFAEKKYIYGSVMKEYEPSDALLQKFRVYMGLLANKDGACKRYLSKNNNNLLRVKALSKQIPDGCYIILWRNPLQTAYSLWRMNERFTAAQIQDSFVLEYMNLIGHYEFGLNHKTFEFNAPFQTKYSVKDPNYWLSYWIYVHTHILNTSWANNVLILNYDQLCLNPQDHLKDLFIKTSISIDPAEFNHGLKQSFSASLPNFEDKLIELALEISETLQEKFGIRNG